MLSTYEVASMIQVTETTVKRWADEGKIPCFKTPGGHRKFNIKDVVDFAESNGFPLAGTKPPTLDMQLSEQLEFGIATRNYRKIADIIQMKLLQNDSAGVLELFQYLYKHHISLTSIADEVIQPALVLIGEMWKRGTLGVNQEHLASEVAKEAMIRFASEVRRKSQNGLTAVCACPEHEYHDLGLRAFAYVLQTEGWNVHYLGANTPFDELQLFVTTVKPHAVCLSITMTELSPEFYAGMKSLSGSTHAVDGKLVVGSYHAGMFRREDLSCDCLAGSAGDALSYLRDAFQLKPGPKKSQPSGSADEEKGR